MTDKKKRSVIYQLIRILMPICLIAAGVSGYKYFKSKETRIKRRPPAQRAVTVETRSFSPADYPSMIQAMGTIVPQKQISLKSKVAGEVVYISPFFVRGGVIKKGEILIAVEDADYQIEIKKAQSALKKALSNLAIEQGNQKIAQEEYKLVHKASKGTVAATDLALRKPQLDQAKAAVESAKADLEKVKLNLSRTKIACPFNSLVIEKNVEMGALVSVQGSVAKLVSTDAYHVETLIPLDKIESVQMGKNEKSQAIIRSEYSKQTWAGTVYRTTGKISQDSRMAALLVVVKDPLGLKKSVRPPSLMLDDFVSVQVLGKPLKNVVELPRQFLRDGDTVWVNQSGRLEIKKVTLVWKQDTHVYISQGIGPEDEIIISDLSSPVNGMKLQKRDKK